MVVIELKNEFYSYLDRLRREYLWVDLIVRVSLARLIPFHRLRCISWYQSTRCNPVMAARRGGGRTRGGARTAGMDEIYERDDAARDARIEEGLAELRAMFGNIV